MGWVPSGPLAPASVLISEVLSTDRRTTWWWLKDFPWELDGNHMETPWKPNGNHMETTWKPHWNLRKLHGNTIEHRIETSLKHSKNPIKASESSTVAMNMIYWTPFLTRNFRDFQWSIYWRALNNDHPMRLEVVDFGSNLLMAATARSNHHHLPPLFSGLFSKVVTLW